MVRMLGGSFLAIRCSTVFHTKKNAGSPANPSAFYFSAIFFSNRFPMFCNAILHESLLFSNVFHWNVHKLKNCSFFCNAILHESLMFSIGMFTNWKIAVSFSVKEKETAIFQFVNIPMENIKVSCCHIHRKHCGTYCHFHSKNGAGAPDSRPRFFFRVFFKLRSKKISRRPLRVFFRVFFCMKKSS